MIKLITTDIDGTLVKDGNNQLNPEYFDVIMKLKKQGIIFAAASGRQYESIVSIFAPIKEDMIFIAENGAFVTCRDQVMSVSRIKKDTVREIIQDMRTVSGGDIFMSGQLCGYIESKDKDYIDLLVNGYQNKIERVDDLLLVEQDCIKISLFHKEGAEEAAESYIVPKWKDKMQVVSAGKEWVDIMNPNINKGTAIRTIQEQLGISKEETMSFGDNLNDIEMLNHAKYSYAIGNAREEVKRTANYIADTNINDGVLKVMKTLLKETI